MYFKVALQSFSFMINAGTFVHALLFYVWLQITTKPIIHCSGSQTFHPQCSLSLLRSTYFNYRSLINFGVLKPIVFKVVVFII